MARREYARIGTDMPDEPSIRALDVEPQWLYDRLLLRPEISRCGVIPYRPAPWADLAPNATEPKVRRWSNALTTSRHVVVDERYAELFIRTFIRHDGILSQPNVVAAMVADYRLIASPAIRLAVLTELRRLWDVDLTPAERGGWLLTMGHYPQAKTGADDAWPGWLPAAHLARLRKAVKDGLRAAFAEALTEGLLAPFNEASPEGIPAPFGEGFTEPTTRVHLQGSAERRAPSAERSSPSAERLPADPNPSTEPAPPSRLPAVNGTHPPDVDQLLDQAGIRVPAIRAKLAAHVTPLLAGQIPTTAIVAGLRDWCTRDRAGPGLLPHLVHDQLTASQRVDPRFAGLIADRDAERTAR